MNVHLQNASEHITDEEMHLMQLRQEEEKTFVELGNKLSTLRGIITNAHNIHRTIRDNLNCAFALYQELREYKDEIGNKQVVKQVQKHMSSKAVQVEPEKRTDSSDAREKGSKRLPSRSPIQEKEQKRQKTAALISEVNIQEEARTSPFPLLETRPWRTVDHRKKKRNRSQNRQPVIRDRGEALTIKAGTLESYAEVIKQMKEKINPTDIGVEVKLIRRTKTGELLVNFGKGEGQAAKLISALSSTFGEDVTIKSLTRSYVVDIRDMDESTEEHELINSLMTATNEQNGTTFRIQNMRSAYGGTRQALVQMPAQHARKLLFMGRIKIGWVMCRVRAKTETTHCYRCLEQGHLARNCSSKDRSELCKRCCYIGHKSKDCKGEKRCILCQEAGLDRVDHFIGSSICVNNRRTHITK